MSKKQKAAGKTGTKSRKAPVAVKKQVKSASRAAAGKSSAKTGVKSLKKPLKAVKKAVTKAIKTIAKKALSGSKSNGSAKHKQDGANNKKVIKASLKKPDKKSTVQVKVAKASDKKKLKPTAKAPERKAIKATSKPEPKKPSAALKPAVAIASKNSKGQVIPPAVKASKNGQEQKAPAKSAAAEKAQPAPEKAGRKLNDLFVKKPIERKPNDVLAITNTIPVKTKSEISPSKIASISYSITNPVRKTDSYAVKPEKEPQGKFELEFVVHASAEMLYEFLSTPSGLSEWFCDDLNIRNGIYTFIWDDQLQQARLLKTIDQQLVRFQWVDKTDGSYFEFRIQRDDLTNDISLIITDFADSVSDRESSKLLWNSQVEKLMHVIGSIF